MKKERKKNEPFLIMAMWCERKNMNKMREIYHRTGNSMAYQAFFVHRHKLATLRQELGRYRGNQTTPFALWGNI